MTTTTRFCYLYRGVDFYIYIGAELPEEYEESRVISERVALQYLHHMPTEWNPIRFTPRDQDYTALSRRLSRD